MNYKLFALYAHLLCIAGIADAFIPQQKILEQKLAQPASRKQNKKATFSFVFHNEELIDVINILAGLKNVNVVLPTGANAISAKVNIAIAQKLTLEEAWDILQVLLDIAGYSMNRTKDTFVIIKNGKDINKEPFPVYINTPIDEIPDTAERIKYMYYLSNIKSQDVKGQVDRIAKDILPKDAIVFAESNTNGILIIAKAQDVRAFIQILKALDETEFKESYEIIHLSYTKAGTIAKIFNESIFKSALAGQRYHLDARQTPEGGYFAGNIKVIADERTNSLILLGKQQALERVRDFVFKYIDVELDSGSSILHTYQLQYLDAKSFADVLSDIVNSARTGGTGQSRAGQAQGGVERVFDEIIIRADTPPPASAEGEVGQYSGGNKIVVAARNSDWKEIKKIIEQLDKPQPQVIIEVLICDLNLNDVRALGAITRNPADIPFPGTASFQAAMIDQVILDKSTLTPPANPDALDSLTGVNSDLNAETATSDLSSTGLASIPNNLTPGTAVLALSDRDGRTWSLMQVLKLFENVRVLSHPHVIAINNQQASISVGETRLVLGQAAPSTSGVTVRNENLSAMLTVKITPRISLANTVNLQVVIDVDQFISDNATSGNRLNRDVVTNANVKTGDILSIGGLVSNVTRESFVRTPWISDIPILGWFFKNKQKQIDETSLTVLIKPTIVQPKIRAGVNDYTKEYIEIAEDYARQGTLFDSLRDPITRWFFKSGSEAPSIAYSFLERSEEDLQYEQSILQEEALDVDPQSIASQQPVIDTTTPLKRYLADEENPLARKRTEIAGAPRIKEEKRPAHTKHKDCNDFARQTTPAHCTKKEIKQTVRDTQYQQKENIPPVDNQANGTLKKMLQTQTNPLLMPAPAVSTDLADLPEFIV